MEIDFKKRNTHRIAENKAEEWMNKRSLPFIRYGMDSLDSELKIWKIPIFVRSAPDYIVFMGENEDKPMFLEAKGFRDIIRLKIRDMRTYWAWNEQLPILMLFYDITNKSYCETMYKDITHIIKTNKPNVGSYPESVDNKFYEIKVEWLPNFTTW